MRFVSTGGINGVTVEKYGSLSSWTIEDIEKYARNAAAAGDLESLSYCLGALSPRHRSGTLTACLNVIDYAQQFGLIPINWLETAAEITARFTPKTTGKHYLYIVLLTGLGGKKPGYGLYVGETSKPPAERFKEHSQGRRNRKGPLYSRIVYRHHKCLLPSLYDHLNPLSRKEARDLEPEITEALKLGGIPVYGGH